MARLIKYLIRWQASGFVLAPVLAIMTNAPIYDREVIRATIVSNFIGGCIFYWIDKKIFKEKKHD